jgi:predicted MFS family arabinose efflux permease
VISDNPTTNGELTEDDSRMADGEHDPSVVRRPSSVVRAVSLWHNRDFVKLWTAKIVSDFGSQLGALGLTALLVLNASPGQMGLLAAVGGAPVLLLGLFAGVWVDRLPRRPLLMAADLGRAALLISVPVAWALGLLHMEQLYLVAALTGGLGVLFDVADPSYLPTLVAREQLVEGNSKLAAATEVAEITSPGAGGAIAQTLGAPIAVVIDSLSFVVSAVSIGLIRTPEPPPRPAAEHAPVFQEIRAGLAFVFRHPVLRALAGNTALWTFAGNFIGALYSLYVIRELGLPPVVMGFSIGAGGVGAIAGTVLAAPLIRRFGVGRTLIGAQVFAATVQLGLPLIGGGPILATVFLLTVQVVGDIGWQVLSISEVSLRQAIIPERLLGRANASMHVLAQGLGPLGALAAGVLGEVIGVRGTLWLAVGGLLLAPLPLIFSPIRHLREAPPAAE